MATAKDENGWERLYVYLVNGKRMSISADFKEFAKVWRSAADPPWFSRPRPIVVVDSDGDGTVALHPSHILAVAPAAKADED